MRVIINEIKKLLNIKHLAIVAIIFFIIWKIFIGPQYIDYFPQGFPELPNFNISQQMLKAFGTTMDKNEFEKLKNDTKSLEQKVDDYLLQLDEARALDIKSFKDLKKYLETNNSYELSKLEEKFFSDNNAIIIDELMARESIIEKYETKKQWMLNGVGIDKEIQSTRIKELMTSDDSNSILSFSVLRNYDWIISYFSILIIITIAFLVAPIFINDNKNKVNYLQSASKIGRKLVTKKIIVAMITSFLVVTVEIILLFAFYVKNNTLQFWNCSINGILSNMISWYDITFGQYIMLSIVLMYLLTFIVTSISIFVSSKAISYVSLIGTQVPILVALSFIFRFFGMYELTSIKAFKYLLFIIYGTLILISIALITMIISKEKIQDILN